MNKHLITIALLINSFACLSQSGFKIESETILKDYYSMGIVDAEIIDNKIFLSCRVHGEDSNFFMPALLTLFNNKVEKNLLIKPNDEVFFSEIKYRRNRVFLLGEKSVGEGIEMQDYIGCFDQNNKQLWTVSLEKKNEGLTKAFYYQEYIEIITQGYKGLFIYKIDYNGKTIEKKSIPILGYVIDAIKISNTDYIILSDSLNSQGESVTFKLSIIDKNCKIAASKNFKVMDSYLPFKLMEFKTGLLIAGNISTDKYMPYLYFFNNDLTIRKSSQYHFEPDYYLFKSSFELKDILYDNVKECFIASAIGKIVNDNTNILFTLNEDKLIDYKLLDISGLWGNNKILRRSNSDFSLFETIKTNDDEDTKIKMINFKID